MDARDTIAVVILLGFAGWLIAIIIGMKVVNSWAQKMADSRAALDAERAELAATASERAETGTVTVTVAETEPE